MTVETGENNALKRHLKILHKIFHSYLSPLVAYRTQGLRALKAKKTKALSMKRTLFSRIVIRTLSARGEAKKKSVMLKNTLLML